MKRILAMILSFSLSWTALPVMADSVYVTGSPPGQNYITTNGNINQTQTIASNDNSLSRNFANTVQGSGNSITRSVPTQTYQNVSVTVSRAATTGTSSSSSSSGGTTTGLSNPNNSPKTNIWSTIAQYAPFALVAAQLFFPQKTPKPTNEYDKFTNRAGQTYYLCSDSTVKSYRGSRWAPSAQDAANNCHNSCVADTTVPGANPKAKGTQWLCRNVGGLHDDQQAQAEALDKLRQKFPDFKLDQGEKLLATYDKDGNLIRIDQLDKDGKLSKSWKVDALGEPTLDISVKDGIYYQRLNPDMLATLKTKGLDDAVIADLQKRMALEPLFMDMGTDGHTTSGNIFVVNDPQGKEVNRQNNQILFADQRMTVDGTTSKTTEGAFVYRDANNAYSTYQNHEAFHVIASGDKTKSFKVTLTEGQRFEVDKDQRYYSMKKDGLHQENVQSDGTFDDKVYSKDRKTWLDYEVDPVVNGDHLPLVYDAKKDGYVLKNGSDNNLYNERGDVVTGTRTTNGQIETVKNGVVTERYNPKTKERVKVVNGQDVIVETNVPDPYRNTTIHITRRGETDFFDGQDAEKNDLVFKQNGANGKLENYNGRFVTPKGDGTVMAETYIAGSKTLEEDYDAQGRLMQKTSYVGRKASIDVTIAQNPVTGQVIADSQGNPILFRRVAPGGSLAATIKGNLVTLNDSGKVWNGWLGNTKIVNGVPTYRRGPNGKIHNITPEGQQAEQDAERAEVRAENARNRVAQPGGVSPGGPSSSGGTSGGAINTGNGDPKFITVPDSASGPAQMKPVGGGFYEGTYTATNGDTIHLRRAYDQNNNMIDNGYTINESKKIKYYRLNNGTNGPVLSVATGGLTATQFHNVYSVNLNPNLKAGSIMTGIDRISNYNYSYQKRADGKWYFIGMNVSQRLIY